MTNLRSLALLAVLWAALAPTASAQTMSDAHLAGRSKTVAVTADDQAVTATGVGQIRLTSDDATSTDRTITLTASPLLGHTVTLILDDTDALELVDTGVQKLNGTWTPVARYETLTLQSDGTNWNEVSRSFPNVTSAMITDAEIVDADVSSSAAIATSKLAGATHTSEGLQKIEHVAMVTYVFATDGGAQSTIDLGVTLPDNVVVTKVIQDIVADCDSTSDTGTIKLNLPTDGDLTAAVTCDGTNAGVLSDLPSGTPIKTTAARALSAVIATNDVLVGTIRWFVYYVQSI